MLKFNKTAITPKIIANTIVSLIKRDSDVLDLFLLKKVSEVLPIINPERPSDLLG